MASAPKTQKRQIRERDVEVVQRRVHIEERDRRKRGRQHEGDDAPIPLHREGRSKRGLDMPSMSSVEAASGVTWPERADPNARPVKFHIAPIGAGPSE